MKFKDFLVYTQEFMKKASALLGCLCLLIFWTGTDSASASAAKSTSETVSADIVFGYVSLSEANVHNELFRETEKWLKTQLSVSAEFRGYAVEELAEAIRMRQVDFVLTTSGFYREHIDLGLKDLATSVYEREPDANRSLGSTFVVLKTRTDLQTLDSLRGMKVSALPESSFVGWQMAAREIILAGFDPHHFFSKIIERRMPMDVILEDVLSGRADVGILRSCQLEEYRDLGYPGIEKLRAMAVRSGSSERCEVSTELYAAYTISTQPETAGTAAKEVLQALLSMPPTKPNGFSWSVATDFYGVDALLKDLKLGPYAYLNQWTISRIWKEFRFWIIMSLLIAGGFVLHYFRTRYLVEVRTNELKASYRELRQMQEQALQSREVADAMEREVIFHHMSGILAHELKAPISTISYFINGVRLRLERAQPDIASALDGLKRIAAILHNTAAAIDAVRGELKSGERESLDAGRILDETMNQFKLQTVLPAELRITWSAHGNLQYRASAYELKLMILNLVKNAVRAAGKETGGKVDVQISALELPSRGLRINVSDNGKGDPDLLNEKIHARFVNRSSAGGEQFSGLGMGIIIVRRLAEAYGGSLVYTANLPVGVCATITLPALEKEKKDE